MDFVKDFAYPYAVQVLGSLLNVPEADMEQIQHWTEDWVTLLFATPPPDQQLPYAQRVLTFLEYMQAMTEQRLREPQDDLVGDMLQATEEGPALSPIEVAAQLQLLFLAGFESTAKLLSN